MSKEAEALTEALDYAKVESHANLANDIIEGLAERGYIITLDPTPLDGSDTKGANLALQRLRELGYKVTFDPAAVPA